MANICAFGFLNCFCQKSCYTGEIILHHWGIEDFLSALTRNVISLFKKCSFLRICCLYDWAPGGWEGLYPHVAAGVREVVFKVAFFLLNVKRKLYLIPKWEVETRLQKGLCCYFCKEHFVKSLQMESSSVNYCWGTARTIHAQTCGWCACGVQDIC